MPFEASLKYFSCAAEVGEGWIVMDDGELTTDTIRDAIDHVFTIPVDAELVLAGRDWDVLNEQHHIAPLGASRRSRGGRAHFEGGRR
jgi:hypothetical protein